MKKQLIILVCTAILLGCNETASPVIVEIADKVLSIKGISREHAEFLEVQLHSDRNKAISSYNEISPSHPQAIALEETYSLRDWDIFYPVIDLELTSGMKGIASFDQPVDSPYSINGMFHQQLFELENGKTEIERKYLQHWENNLYINNGDAALTSFYLRDLINVQEGNNLDYRLLSPQWSGTIIALNSATGDTILNQKIRTDYINPDINRLSQFKENELSQNRLMASLAATVQFTLGTQDRSPNGKTKNGLNLFYDLEAKTYRRPTWVWGTGPSIKLLLEASKYPEITEQVDAETLIKTAKEIGEVALPLQIKNPESPAYGVVISRWSENKGTLKENFGLEEYYSVADAQFFVGWGWIPLYQQTKDIRFLEGARLMTAATDRLIKQFDLTPMDYMVRAKKWKNYALNEQGFATEGINELYKVDPNPDYQRIGDEYMQMLLKKFDTPSGIWNRIYRIETDVAEPTRHHTRGVGWAMEGLIAVYELTQNPLYLEKAVKMGNHLIDKQLSNGSWSYDFYSQDEQEISEKGTALWSLLFYKLHAITGDPVHMATARKALLWCLDNQYDGPDPHAYGGIIGQSRQSAVIYRHWFPLACTYTSGFFGLAVIEELKLQENES